MGVRTLTRVALLLALMVVAQSLRLCVPLPFYISMYGVGSLVNACLLLALAVGGLRAGLVLACIAPVIAFFQQLLPLPALVLPVAAANAAYLAGYYALRKKPFLAISAAAAAKFVFLYATVEAAATLFALPELVTTVLSLLLGWPQWITGLGGGVIFLVMRKRMSAFARA